MTVPKATLEHQFSSHRRSFALTDAPPVQKIHLPEVEFVPTLAVIEWHRYDDEPWELNDVRVVRVMAHSTMDLNMYGNTLDAMPQWLLDLVRHEAPRGD